MRIDTRIGAFLAVAGASISLAQAATADPIDVWLPGATFESSARVRWIPDSGNKYSGEVTKIESDQISDTVFRFTDDPRLAALGDLPAHIEFHAYYFTLGGENYPGLEYNLDITYTGKAPIFVRGKTFGFGATLLSAETIAWGPPTFDHAGGSFSAFSDIADYAGPGGATAFGEVFFDPLPTVHFDPGSLSRYPYIDAGEGGLVRGRVQSYFSAPEPSAWLMLIAGFAVIGSRLRAMRNPARSREA